MIFLYMVSNIQWFKKGTLVDIDGGGHDRELDVLIIAFRSNHSNTSAQIVPVGQTS